MTQKAEKEFNFMFFNGNRYLWDGSRVIVPTIVSHILVNTWHPTTQKRTSVSESFFNPHSNRFF
jgi:hypothetical protein